MTALKDTRPHVFRELPMDPVAKLPEEGPYAALVGRLVGELLDTWPDVDLPTIRLWEYAADGGVHTVRVDARRGQLPGPECPQCHTGIGRPHTEYCTLSPDAVWVGMGNVENLEYPGQPGGRAR